MVPYLTESRSKQKMLGRQLFVLDDMMQLLERLESTDQLLNEPCPPNPGNEAHRRWKALKSEYKEGVQEVETLISTLQDRMDKLHHKRNRLTHLVTALEKKKELSLQMGEALQRAHNALRVCEGQLAQLRAETDASLDRLADWQHLREALQGYVEETRGVMQCRLLSVGSSELCVELRPHSCGSSSSSGQLEPLRLTVTWSPDDHFHLQVYQGTAGLLEESIKGHLSHLSAALLEVMQCYTSQREMLAEIQALHSRFAIDWRPGQRLLVFLKTASRVCNLGVEEGYPSKGTATLISVHRDGELVDNAVLQPPQKTPSLTEWLELLSSSPYI
ncbi:uncharacterized protein si:dkey-225f5.4 [Coregonus clupeaformis]|uniref:uncharacterized protein si:dkey-225f5.4 n=1 Tax=Coregonus clupeaformis TaxID=59861 RepID=UPI001E1C4D40|nr:uncharacterized protein si:dkey-225f5.4 [Coregonus clupeaformis]XP_041736734.2 uncharacterized protein si:dkey-225f5.4 [Coregonus clupeaformis]